jgi:hypothetical protein
MSSHPRSEPDCREDDVQIDGAGVDRPDWLPKMVHFVLALYLLPAVLLVLLVGGLMMIAVAIIDGATRLIHGLERVAPRLAAQSGLPSTGHQKVGRDSSAV